MRWFLQSPGTGHESGLSIDGDPDHVLSSRAMNTAPNQTFTASGGFDVCTAFCILTNISNEIMINTN